MASNIRYSGPSSLPDNVPVFPLSGALLLPRAEMPLNIFEPRYLEMIDDALGGARLIGMVQPASGDDSDAAALYPTGCLGRLTGFMESGDGRYLITLTGISRFRIVDELPQTKAYRECRIDAAPYAEDFVPAAGGAFDRNRLLDALRAFLTAHDLSVDWDEINEADDESLLSALAMSAPYGVAEKQALLEARDLAERAELLIAITERELGTDLGNADIRLQ